MNADFIGSLLQFGLLLKLFLLVIVLFFFVFATIVYRQITLMTQTLNSSISPAIRFVALVQIVVIAVLFFLVVIFV